MGKIADIVKSCWERYVTTREGADCAHEKAEQEIMELINGCKPPTFSEPITPFQEGINTGIRYYEQNLSNLVRGGNDGEDS